MKTSKIDTSTEEFQQALSLVSFTSQSLFLTGKAGTGKSTFLHFVCQHVKKKHVVLAPTGIAAINVGGSTIHSFFKLPFHPFVPEDPRFSPQRLRSLLKYNKQHIKMLQQLELIIIDEISMVRADIIDFIDRILRVCCHNMREPFAGKQLLMVGDVFQLEPVLKADERDILTRFYPNPYFFSAHVFKEMKLVSIELQKNYRQRDLAFSNTLDHIRSNQMTDLELQLINTRYSREPAELPPHQMNVALVTRRDHMDFTNQEELQKLDGSLFTLKGEIKGDFPESSLPTLLELEVKLGAQVIFVKNDPEKRWVNGTLGIISEINDNGDMITVVNEDGIPLDVRPEIWSNIRYTYNEREKKIEEEELGTFVQFPIRLAWAITIHKSQGLTFQHVTIDLTGGTFAGGQAYVALSRCTSLDGITLRHKIQRSDIFINPQVVQFASAFNNEKDLKQALQIAQADTEYHAAVKAFDKGDMEAFLHHFFKAIHLRYDIEKPLPQRFIRRKLGVIRRLREQNEAMKARLLEQNEKMGRLAKEYLAMGNQCVTQAKNLRAAIANYSKALDLNPLYIDAWVRRGNTYLDMGDTDKSLADLHQAVRLSPSSFKAAYNRGRIFLEKGLPEEAIKDLSRATSLKYNHSRAHKLLGDALSMAGDEENALIHWEIARQLAAKSKNKE